MTTDVPKDLESHRAELRRAIEADEEAAAVYAAKAIDLRRSAELLLAELSGIERAIEAYRGRIFEQLVPRRVLPVANAGDDD